jgi:hypothetical protein
MKEQQVLAKQLEAKIQEQEEQGKRARQRKEKRHSRGASK